MTTDTNKQPHWYREDDFVVAKGISGPDLTWRSLSLRLRPEQAQPVRTVVPPVHSLHCQVVYIDFHWEGLSGMRHVTRGFVVHAFYLIGERWQGMRSLDRRIRKCWKEDSEIQRYNPELSRFLGHLYRAYDVCKMFKYQLNVLHLYELAGALPEWKRWTKPITLWETLDDVPFTDGVSDYVFQVAELLQGKARIAPDPEVAAAVATATKLVEESEKRIALREAELKELARKEVESTEAAKKKAEEQEAARKLADKKEAAHHKAAATTSSAEPDECSTTDKPPPPQHITAQLCAVCRACGSSLHGSMASTLVDDDPQKCVLDDKEGTNARGTPPKSDDTRRKDKVNRLSSLSCVIS